MPESLSEKTLYQTCIDLETALRTINPDDADLCWEVNENDIRTCNSPDQVFSERVLEKCLLQAEIEDEQKRKQEELGEQGVLEKQPEKDNPWGSAASGLMYKPLTADEMTVASEGLEPILYTGASRTQVYYNAHKKRKHRKGPCRTGFRNKRTKAADDKED